MNVLRGVRSVVAVCIVALIAQAAAYQPERVSCIAPSDPGGGWDFTCRSVSRMLLELDLVPTAVQTTNMTGAGGGVAFAHVVGQQRGNDNVLIAASTVTAVRIAQEQFLGFSEDDVRWLGAIGADFGVIAVRSDAPWQNLADLFADVESDPRSIIFGGGNAVGSWNHLRVLLIAQDAGLEDLTSEIRYVPFSGATALPELLAGRVQAYTGDISDILGFLESGDIRVLAVLSEERLAEFPAIPTAIEQGYDVVGANWRGFYMPPGVSDEAYQYWVDALQALEQSEAWATELERSGLSRFWLGGARFDDFIRQQVSDMRLLSKELGVIQ